MNNYLPNIEKIENASGPTLCYSSDSGVKIIEKDGLFFKDLSKDGELHPYEDWRLSPEERAKDLAGRMTSEEIAGLMMYSGHQFIPGLSNPYFGKVTYGGKDLSEIDVPPYAISDRQIELLSKDGMRHFLIASVKSASDAALWNNNMQACAEKLPFGIPINNSTDPRHGTNVSMEFDVGANGDISHWPEPLGLAATFSPELVEQFGDVASKEYRAIGISTALSPQIDLATEPRWPRFLGTFGESPTLSADLARAYCDGFQTSKGDRETQDGWGYDSVNAMVKHWPGGGADESGRDAHFGTGKFSVFPGNNFAQHQVPFVEGAFKLNGKTGKASAVMPYYTVAWDQDKANGENVGISFNKYLITDLLRNQYSYDEVVCTDWGILRNPATVDSLMGGKCWGVEHLTEVERCYKAILAGVDQFGGLMEKSVLLGAYELGVAEFDEEFMHNRFVTSAVRLLKNIFRTGMFENPYLDVEATAKLVGNPDYMAAGYEAQIKSLVMCKNKNNVLPLAQKTKVFVPKIYHRATVDWMGQSHPERWSYPINLDLLKRDFIVTDDIIEAEAAMCFIRMPSGGGFSTNGYSAKDVEQGGNGYIPMSLQYRPYSAKLGRETSIAGGDPHENFTNRSYNGKTVTSETESDLDLVLEAKKVLGDKPVIVCVKMEGPMIVSEFEPNADAILASFGDLHQALVDVISGKQEPSGLLPMQLPANMDTVEKQLEDVPFDMECHVDTEGHAYDFAYGMNWVGVIQDERVRTYAPVK